MCRPNLYLSGLLAAASLLSAGGAQAADGTWTKIASGGLWSDTANWSGGVVADGSGAAANLGTLNLTAANIVLFDAPHTLGGLLFCDTASTYYNWTLSNNGNAANVLTLEGTAPFITVSNVFCTNNLAIAGTNGFTVQGGNLASSGLVLAGTNTFTGDVIVKTGNGGSGSVNTNINLYVNNGWALGGPTSTSAVYLVCLTNRAVLNLNCAGIYTYSNNLIMRPLGTIASSRAEFRVLVANSTNTWNGNILLDGASGATTAALAPLCDIYCDGTASMLTINGNVLSTNNFFGGFDLRGASTGIVNGWINLPGVAFSKNDLGTWTLNSPNNVWSNTAVQTGTLKLGANNALPINTAITIGGGSATAYLDLNGYSQILSNSVASSGGNPNRITNSSPTLSVLTYSNTVSASCAVITCGNMSLVKTDVGTLTLTTANTYTGNTVINAGTLALGSSASLAGSPNIIIASGARFSLAATLALGSGKKLTGDGGTLAGNLNLSAGSLALNYTGGTPALTVTNGTLTFAGNAVTVTVSGSPLALGSYKLVAKDTGGAVSGTLPTGVTVDGSGAVAPTSLQIVGGELYLVVAYATSTDLVASANPSSFMDNVTFTATVLTGGSPATDATGTMSFSTNGSAWTASAVVSGVASVNLASLPRGTNLITAIYSGDVSYLPSTNTLSQVVNNHLPIAGNLVVTRNAGVNAVRVAISDVLAQVTDVDSDTITLVGTGTSTNGVVVTQSGVSYLYYNNPNNVDDAFTYTVTDGFGGTNSGTISFVVNTAVGQATGQITSFAGGVANLTFHGIPNYTYVTERSTDLSNWVDVSTNTAAANGEINMSDAFSDLGGVPPSAAYYRLKWQP